MMIKIRYFLGEASSTATATATPVSSASAEFSDLEIERLLAKS